MLRFTDAETGEIISSGTCYVACPDSTFIEEYKYNGDGMFGGKHIYELVVDWNKDKLYATMLKLADSDRKFKEENNYMIPVAAAYQYESEENAAMQAAIIAARRSVPDSFASDWKQHIGRAMVTLHNADLPNPVKITKKRVFKTYAMLKASEQA